MILNKRHKFSLIELLLVMAVIAILISILIPTLGKARKQSRIVLSMNNLKQIHTAVFLYAGNNDQYVCRADSDDDQEYAWRRYIFENMAGYKFSSRSNDSKQEMAADATYEGMMFCPVQRAIRGKPEHHGQGRGDYGMNRYFNKKNRVKLTRLAGKGKLEAFIVPTNAMNSTQAHQVVRNTFYDPSKSNTANYDYLGKSLGLYIDGNVKPFTIEHGESIDPAMFNRPDFQ